MTTIIKGSSKRGQDLISRGNNYAGIRLNDVYTNWSSKKEQAYWDCMETYLNTPNHDNFRIISANTYQFSVSWRGNFENDRAMFIMTASSFYVILLDK